MRIWLRLAWWRYLLAPYDCVWVNDEWRSLLGWSAYESGPRPWSWPGWRTVWCRLHLHPRGELYFTATGLEPDSRCRDCGEHLY